MGGKLFLLAVMTILGCAGAETVRADRLGDLMSVVCHNVSGNRAHEYTARMWQYDKWSTLPMWKKSSEEARSIMLERGFDEAKLFSKPADGRTKVATWTNPIGWDAKSATLEVIQPANLPEEYRYLCDYRSNPTSLGCWSAPTPPEGLETELALLEQSNPDALAQIEARGKILLVSSGARGLKKHLDRYGVIGVVSDEIEGHSRDSINANNWQNGWTDLPGGWLMTDYDAKNHIQFSISQKKANYLRDLLRRGVKVKVRAKVDSRYYTNDTLPYTTGFVRGTGDEEVLIGGHNHEWGASDNAAGCAAAIEAAGALNDLIRSGALPRPKRGIRLWFGQEIYGSLAYAVDNLERLNEKTVAALMLDDGGLEYENIHALLEMIMNPNCCPSYTDALLVEIARRYFAAYAPERPVLVSSYSNADNFYCDPEIGVPSHWIKMNNGNYLHHNSKDTIDQVDARSLRDTAILGALFVYYLADADESDLPWLATLTRDRGMEIILHKYSEMCGRIETARDSQSLGRVLQEGSRTIAYYAGLQKQALLSIERIIPPEKRAAARAGLAPYTATIDELGALMVKQFRNAVEQKAKTASLSIVPLKKQESPLEREAGTIKPKRNQIGIYSLQGIPVEDWVEVSGDPHWWGATTWAAASLWWCDGKRNLNEIKELCELEAGRPMSNFDLVKYYRFLEKHDLVEFVK